MLRGRDIKKLIVGMLELHTFFVQIIGFYAMWSSLMTLVLIFHFLINVYENVLHKIYVTDNFYFSEKRLKNDKKIEGFF